MINTEVTDGTDKIAEESGARVFREAWKGFIGQKNSALDKATQPWMLSLDADEEVTPELRAEITKVIGQANACAAYAFPRCTFAWTPMRGDKTQATSPCNPSIAHRWCACAA